MTRTVRSRRLAFVASVLIVGLTACGVAEPEPAAAPVGSDGPAVIVVPEGAWSAAGAGTAAPMSEAAADSRMMAAYLEFVYEGTPPDMTAPAPSWYFPTGQSPTEEQIANAAAVFGIDGPVRELSAEQGAGWQAGSADGTGDSFNVGADAMQSWWYSPSYADTAIGTSCDMYPPGDPMASEDSTLLPECEPVQPPDGVPTASEAEAKAGELLTALGLDPAAFVYDTYADEWSASVMASLTFEGVRSTVSVSFGFGEDGEVTWASGYLAAPHRGDDYPRIGVEDAVVRLNEQQVAWMGISARPGAAVPAGSADTVAIEPAVEQNAPAVDAPAAPDTPASGSGVAEPAVSPSEFEEPLPDTIEPDVDVTINPMPVEPIEPIGPIEPIVVTLSGGEPTLEQLWAVDGTVWLVPGYAFSASDGGRYTVMAIPSEYLQTQPVEAVPVPEPGIEPDTVLPTEPAVDPSVVPGAACPDFVVPTGNTDAPIESEDGAEFIGLCTADAMAVAAGMGYQLRVIREDGVDQPATMDLRPDRINVAVVDGIVTEIISFG